MPCGPSTRTAARNVGTIEVNVPGAMSARPVMSKAAVTSFVSSLVGVFLLLPLIAPLIAVAFGVAGLVGIRRSQGRVRGTGLAVAGLILGVVGTALSVLVIGSLVSMTGMSAEIYEKVHSSAPLIELNDWDAVAKNATGDGGLTREEFDEHVRRLQEPWGKIRTCRLASIEPEPREIRGVGDLIRIPFRATFNIQAEKGVGHVALGFRHNERRELRITSITRGSELSPVKIRP